MRLRLSGLLSWNKLHMQEVCSNRNMIKIEASGHESTSSNRKRNMNVRRHTGCRCTLRAGTLIEFTFGLFLLCCIILVSLPTILIGNVPLWSSYLLGHQRFALSGAKLRPLPQFISRSALLHPATNTHDVWSFGLRKSNFCFQQRPLGFNVTSNRLITLSNSNEASARTFSQCTTWIFIR